MKPISVYSINDKRIFFLHAYKSSLSQEKNTCVNDDPTDPVPRPKNFFHNHLEIAVFRIFLFVSVCRNMDTTAVTNTTIMQKVTIIHFSRWGRLANRNSRIINFLKDLKFK